MDRLISENEDYVSRTNLISKLEILDRRYGSDFYWETRKIVDKLPSVKPQEPNTGHWIFDEILDRNYYCSECKSMGVDYWDYCPYCGCKMVEPQERSDKE